MVRSPMEMTQDIIDYESGEMAVDRMVYMFRDMMNNGMIVSLQGHYQRQANTLTEHLLIVRNERTMQWEVNQEMLDDMLEIN